jgi:hypothetical protein
MKLQNEEALMLLQRVLGQLLFYPPNVAGWPGGTTWIDSSSLMMRMRIPRMINDTDEMNVRPKDDDDQMMGRPDPNEDPKAKAQRMAGRAGKPILASIDWSLFFKNFESIPREQLSDSVSKTLLQVKSSIGMDIIKQYSDQSGRENFIKTAAIQVMSTPEYQLC